MARRITKASKRRLTIFGTISLIAIIYFVFSLFYNIYTIYDLQKEKEELEKKYIQLQEESENLKIDIEKLNDPDYLANYARENYLYSKEGEYVLQLKEETEDTEDKINIITDNLRNNYIMLGLTIFVIFIFIVVVNKGNKRSRKNRKNKKGVKV